MKKEYRVYQAQVNYMYVLVQAESPEEALLKVISPDPETNDYDPDWHDAGFDPTDLDVYGVESAKDAVVLSVDDAQVPMAQFDYGHMDISAHQFHLYEEVVGTEKRKFLVHVDHERRKAFRAEHPNAVRTHTWIAPEGATFSGAYAAAKASLLGDENK